MDTYGHAGLLQPEQEAELVEFKKRCRFLFERGRSSGQRPGHNSQAASSSSLQVADRPSPRDGDLNHENPFSCLRLGVAAVLGTLAGGIAVPLQSSAPEPPWNCSRPGFDEQLDGEGLPRDWSASADRILWREGLPEQETRDRLAAGASCWPARTSGCSRASAFDSADAQGEGGSLGGALILHGEEKPQREMPPAMECAAVGGVRNVRRHVHRPEPGCPAADLQRRARDDRV